MRLPNTNTASSTSSTAARSRSCPWCRRARGPHLNPARNGGSTSRPQRRGQLTEGPDGQHRLDGGEPVERPAHSDGHHDPLVLGEAAHRRGPGRVDGHGWIVPVEPGARGRRAPVAPACSPRPTGGLGVTDTPRISRASCFRCAVNGAGPCVPFDAPITTNNTLSVASFAGIQAKTVGPKILTTLTSADTNSDSRFLSETTTGGRTVRRPQIEPDEVGQDHSTPAELQRRAISDHARK